MYALQKHHFFFITAIAGMVLGCGGAVDVVKYAIGTASDSADEPPQAQAPPPAVPGQTTTQSVVIMGSPGQLINLHTDASIDLDSDDNDPHFGPVVKQLSPGQRGQVTGSRYAALWTYAIEVKMDDGSIGVLSPEDVGQIHRVTKVRLDDTLNVRSGPSHKRTKVAEIGPTALVFVNADSAGSAAGCDGMSGSEKWWRVRTLNGVEGYVNCRYIGMY